MKIWTHLFQTALVAMLMSTNVANAQNILVLTTGGQNSRPAPELENKYMPTMVQEFSSPLTFGDFTNGGNPCSGTNSTTVGSLTKSVTCNQTELVNGTVMASSTFDPGYDLLVVASAYTTIDAADWAVIEDAVQTRKVRGAVFFIDTINGANTTAIEGLLSRVMGAPVTQGSQFPGGNFYFPLNTAAAAQSSFTGLPTLELNSGFYAYNGVPSRYALYTGVNGLATATPGNATDPTSATGIFVPQSDSYAGAGACVFGVTDIGWGGSGTGHNIGKLGNAFLTELNKSAPDGICATPLAAPPTLAIQKTTTANTAASPSNGVAVPYTVEVSNVSTTALALNVGVSDPQPTGITLGQWACTQISPAAPANLCPTGLPTGDLVTTIASLPAGAKLQFTTNGTVTDNTQSLTNVATLQLPPGAICDGGGTPCTSQVSFALPKATPAPVPSLGQWATLGLSILVALFGVGLSRRQLRE